jgi:hypothetical protein
LPAANAALVALMQNTRSAAATISMVNLMARLLHIDATSCFADFTELYHQGGARRSVNRPGPCIKIMHALHKRNPARVPIPA